MSNTKLVVVTLWLCGLWSVSAVSAPTLASAVPVAAQLGEACVQQYSHGIYQDIASSNTNCAESLTCHVAPNDTGMIPMNGVLELQGTCQKSTCVSTATATATASSSAATATSPLVTICHANTDPETATLNPWIRMTVSEQAFHEEREDCGFTEHDFVVRHHGSRQQVADQMAKGEMMEGDNFLSENDYWKYWESACPFVRQDPNHPQRCCRGDDCCMSEEELRLSSTSSSSRTLQDEDDEECTEDPTDFFSQDIYITFMGEPGRDGESLADHLASAASTDIATLEDTIQSEFNFWGGNGKCVYFSRLIQDVTIDTSSSVPAMNKDYDLVGFRVRATIQGLCTGCANRLFLPSDNCKETVDTLCGACVELSNSEPGFIKQIPGKELYPRINAAMNLQDTSAEIFRMQGDVQPESPACDSAQVKYLEATGEVVCL